MFWENFEIRVNKITERRINLDPKIKGNMIEAVFGHRRISDSTHKGRTHPYVCIHGAIQKMKW